MIHLYYRSTKAAEDSAKAARRIAVAQEKSGKHFLDYLFAPENADLLEPATRNKAETPKRQQPRKRP